MKFNLLISTSQLNSNQGVFLGTGTNRGILHLAQVMRQLRIKGDIYSLPGGSRSPGMASPFSINSGFALNIQELDLLQIPELKSDPQLLSSVSSLQKSYRDCSQNSRIVSYTLKSTLLPGILEQCYKNFSHSQDSARKEQFSNFKKISQFWLDHYAIYQSYLDAEIDLNNHAYHDLGSNLFIQFKEINSSRIDYYRYLQLLCFEQRRWLLEELRSLGIGLILNLPFGIIFESADLFFNPDAFTPNLQVGCSPEAQYGYPEQAWGVAVYNEQSPALAHYLRERMQWLSRLGDGVFIDHLVGWSGQYVLPLDIADDATPPHGHFLTENPVQREENIRWFLNLLLNFGLSLKAEIAGDCERVQITRKVVNEMVEQGNDIMAMAIPRWESYGDKLKTLKEYKTATLLMMETHDTSTLLQFLLNRKGHHQDFEERNTILNFCRRVLALPLFYEDIPLDLKEINFDFSFEICRRVLNGSKCRDVLFSLSSLLSLLSKADRNSSLFNNINIKPGASGKIGNEWNNWSFFSPPLETMLQDSEVCSALKRLGNREYKPFTPFEQLHHFSASGACFEVIYATPTNRAILYQNKGREWKHWQPQEREPILELLLKNRCDYPLSEWIDISSVLNLDYNGSYVFLDLLDDETTYTYTAYQLKTEKLYIHLAEQQIHHFLVFRVE